MLEYKNVLQEVLTLGEERETRTGKTISTFCPRQLFFHMDDGFPAVTGKKLAWNLVVGELLWFLSGSTQLSKLRTLSNLNDGVNTIWTKDQQRFMKSLNSDDKNNCGRIYGHQWRSFSNKVDQISNLIHNLKEFPNSRKNIVTSMNPADLSKQCLSPCHSMFQCYVDNNNYLSISMYQASADMFLGLPFNIASYALLLHILAKLTGYKAGSLLITLGDAHIYVDHLDAVNKYLSNKVYDSPTLKMPDFKSLEDLVTNFRANDFELVNYQHCEPIKAELFCG